MKKILVQQLRFSPADVRVLRPEIAAMLVANKLFKPVEGMPVNWYVSDVALREKKTMPMTPTALVRQRFIKASAAIVTIGIVVLVSKGQEVNLDHLSELLHNIPKAIVAAFVGSLSSSRPVALPVVVAEEEDNSSSTVVGEEGEGEEALLTEEVADDHPHSLKPGSTQLPSYEEDLDKSALDKLITKIENGFKSLFRMKI